MTSRMLFVVLGVAVCLLAAPSPSVSAAPPSEQQQVAQAIEQALQKHGGDVHACFAKVLADRLDRAGKVEVAVEIGKGGKVKAAKVQKADKSAGRQLAACIEQAARGWTVPGIAAGSTVVLPFAFKAQGSQYVVNTGDIPDRALGGASPGKAKGRPSRAAPFTVKVLADAQNVKAEGLSLTLLTVGPASRVAMHRHAHCAKILYLLKGHSRLLGPKGVAPLKLEEGEAVFIPAGYPHVIENMGRQSTGVFLQAFSPPGPERVYRNPKDARGRAEFEVIRDPSTAKAPANSQMLATPSDEAKAIPLPKNAGVSKSLVVGPGGFSLALLELADGAELQSPGVGTTELLYFISGKGSIKIGGETAPLAAESLVHAPRGTGYVIKVAAADKNEKIVVARFRASARTTPAAAPNRGPSK